MLKNEAAESLFKLLSLCPEDVPIPMDAVSIIWEVCQSEQATKVNVLAVRADASYGSGHWYEGGGLYRHVSLVRTSAVHVEQEGSQVYGSRVYGPRVHASQVHASQVYWSDESRVCRCEPHPCPARL